MADEKLTPERAVRLLRAKGAELEAQVLAESMSHEGIRDQLGWLKADIALIAQLVADDIERNEARWDSFVKTVDKLTGLVERHGGLLTTLVERVR